MTSGYDMYVDYDILCDAADKLQKIEYDINNSTSQMVSAIESSQNFLAGNQFEKAKRITYACVEVTQKTENNVRHAIDYLESLKSAIIEYAKCGYDEEA